MGFGVITEKDAERESDNKAYDNRNQYANPALAEMLPEFGGLHNFGTGGNDICRSR